MEGERAGFTFKVGRGRGDLTAFAGTERGLKVLAELGWPGVEG